MTSIVVFFETLPPPVVWTTYSYLSAIVLYNGGASYIDAKRALNDYRNQNFDRFGSRLFNCKDEFQAVKFGSSYNFYVRLVDSIIWPIRLTSNIIPYVALKMNPPNSNNAPNNSSSPKDTKND